jgi:hypothetical protein
VCVPFKVRESSLSFLDNEARLQLLFLLFLPSETKLFVPETGTRFGWSVSLSEQRFAAGAPSDNVKGTHSGSVSIFEKHGDSWTRTAKLVASDGAANDFFGSSVALSGDELLVGAARRNDKGASSGAVYVFSFDGTLWNETQKLLASDGSAEAWFGQSISRKGNRAVIGAPGDRHGTGCTFCGKAYVFSRAENMWTEEAILKDQQPEEEDLFGTSVATDGDRVVVGIPQDNDKGSNSGSAAVFEKIGGTWNETIKLYASDASAGAYFCWSVSMDGDILADLNVAERGLAPDAPPA